ncbi:MAG: RDD family protein [Gammaproteobacteria bacterium]|jgi:uncharacterized RDD family membrane protein YckC
MSLSYLDYPSASLFKRLASMVYDALIVIALWFLITFIFLAIRGADITESNPHALRTQLFPLLLLGTFAFYAWFWTHGGQTLGMRAWRLQVVDAHLDGRPVNLVQCLSRFLIALISLSAFGLGYWWVLISPSGDTWHDTFSGTRTLLLPKDENKKLTPARRQRR